MKNLSKFFEQYFVVISIAVIVLATFLRVWKLDSLPPSIYWEEAALGYDAYSILKTGKDHHGQSFPLIAFTSFGDYKPSGYFYAVVPFITVFGLNETAVRLPSAIAGVFTVLGMGFLARYFAEVLWPKQNISFYKLVFLLGMSIATISPWLIQFSRGGWEVNGASCLLLWSIIFGLRASTTSKPLPQMFLTALLAVLSMYTYHATRVIAPAMFVGLSVIWFLPSFLQSSKRKEVVKQAVGVFIFFALLIAPLLLAKNPVTQQRFAETSLYADGQYVKSSNQFRDMTGNSVLSRFFGHRYVFLVLDIVKNFSTHFSLNFLFIVGDQNLRHSTGFTGILYIVDALWLVLGLVFLAWQALQNKKSQKYLLFLLWWLFIGILPAAITKAAPHALRILPTAPVFLLVIILGITTVFLWLKEKKLQFIFGGAVLVFILLSFGQWLMFWRYYTRVYPALTASEWQYGYKQMVQQLNTVKNDRPDQKVFVTREYGRPAMYYWFFSKTDPVLVQAEEKTAKKDQAEFLTFQNIEFINSVNEAGPGVVVSSQQQFSQLENEFSSVEKIGEVRDLRGQVVWVLTEVH
jgi:hypothetical protein